MVWANIAVIVASYILSVAFAPKPPQQRPAAFEDFDFPLFEEGEPKTAVFGQCWSKSWMCLTVGNYRTRRVKIGGGKK